jgi:DNA-binding SARP family transcriptional activator
MSDGAERPTSARIVLCGQLTVELDGRRVESQLPGPQGRVLVAFLAANRTRPCTREELIDALWPGDRPANAETRLRTALSKVRRVVGPGVIEGRATIALSLGPSAWIDLEATSQAMKRSVAAAARGEWPETLAAAQLAADLAEGQFMAGYDAPWIERRRRALADLRIDALELVAQAGIELGRTDLVVAERAARALIEMAPFKESGYRLLMEAHAGKGDVAEALIVYEVLRCLLRDELGTTPAVPVKELHQQLLTERRSSQ